MPLRHGNGHDKRQLWTKNIVMDSNLLKIEEVDSWQL